MVFVHARNATVRTAMGLREKAKNNGHICYFLPTQGPDYGQSEKQVSDSFALLKQDPLMYKFPSDIVRIYKNQCGIVI